MLVNTIANVIVGSSSRKINTTKKIVQPIMQKWGLQLQWSSRMMDPDFLCKHIAPSSSSSSTQYLRFGISPTQSFEKAIQPVSQSEEQRSEIQNNESLTYMDILPRNSPAALNRFVCVTFLHSPLCDGLQQNVRSQIFDSTSHEMSP